MAAQTNGLSLLEFEKDIALNHEEKRNSISLSAYGLSRKIFFRKSFRFKDAFFNTSKAKENYLTCLNSVLFLKQINQINIP